MFLIRKGVAGLALALLTVLAVPQAFATIYYADINGGNWAANTTWHLGSNSGPVAAPGTYPGSAPGDTAKMDFQGEVINVTSVVPNAVILEENNVSMFLNVNAAGVLPLTGASFVGGGAVLVLNGGTINNAGTLDIQINSGMSLVSGTLTGAGTTNIAADLSLPGLLTIAGGTLDAHTLNINGKAKYTGSWSINNGATVNVSSTGLFDIQSLAAILSSGGGAINNSGKVEKTSGAGGTNIVPPLNNNNLVKVSTGDLVMNGTHLNGTFDIAAGSSLELAGTIQGACIAQGAGQIKIVTQLTIDNLANFAVSSGMRMSGGVLQGPVAGSGEVDNTGPVPFDGGTWSRNLYVHLHAPTTLDFSFIGASILTNDTRVTNDSTININAAALSLAIDNGSYITNNNTINIIGDATINSDSVNNARIDNSAGASIFKTSGAGYATFNVILNNGGNVQSNSGNMKFTKSGTHTGTFWICDACVFDWAGGTHTLTGAVIRYINFNAGAIAKLTGATFDVTTSAQVDANDFFHTAGTITGDGSFAVFANYTWSGGTHSGLGDTQLASFTHLFDGATGPMILDGRAMSINGIVTYAPVGTNYLAINNGSVLTNPGYTFTMTTDAPILSDGTGDFENAGGTVQKTGGAGIARIAAIFNSYTPILVDSRGPVSHGLVPFGATLNVLSGQVALNGGGSNSGNIFVPNAANAVVIEAGIYTFNAGTFTNPLDLGVFRIDGGELDMGAAMSLKNVELLSGILCGADLTITNKLVWKGGSIEGLGGNTTIASTATLSHLAPTLPTFLDGRILHIDGIADYEGSGLQMLNGAVINNNLGATFNVRDGFISNGPGTNIFNNIGTLKKVGVSSGMRFDVPVKNTGTISSEVSGQSIIFANGGSMDPGGTLTTTAGALIDFFNGVYDVLGGSMTGAGQLRVNGGTLKIDATMTAATTVVVMTTGILDVAPTIAFDVNTLLFTGGVIEGPGVTRALGGSIGNAASTGLSADGTLKIASASFTYDADAVNYLTIFDTSELLIENGAAFSITGDSILDGSVLGVVTNNGTLRKTGGAGTARILMPVTSGGTALGSNSGTLRLEGGGTITGGMDIGGGATLAFSTGSFFINAGASISGGGTFSVLSGSVDVSTPLTIPNLALSGGALTGSGALTLNNPQWTGGDLNGGTASVAGTMTISTAAVKSLGRVLTNNNTVDLRDGSIGGGGSFTNNATFNRSTVNTPITFAPAFSNGGTVNLLTGSLAFNGGYTQTAGITNLAGGNMSSPLTIFINGGTLKGNGTVSGSVSNSATVAPGASPGLITIAGNYSQTPSGILDIELAGTTPGSGYDRLAVSGAATLSGTVNVTLISGFTLSGGDLFDVVTYTSHSGVFTTENLPPFPGGTFSSTYTATSYQLLAATPSAADVSISKTGPANAASGDFVNYTIVVKNLGPGSAAGIIVSDPTPPGLEFQANTGDCTTPFPCTLGTLAANETRTIIATYRVTTTGGSTITNTATLNVTDPNNSNNSASASTAVACPAITPTNLKPSGSAASSGNLSWSPTGAEVYEVFLGPKGSGCSTSFGKTLSSTMPYQLQPNTEYEWRVEASFDGCPVQSSGCVTFKTDACAIPDAPLASVVGQATSTKSYRVEWEQVSGATRYEVDEAANAGFTGPVTTTVTEGLSVEFNHEAAQPTGYYYRVRALNDCNDEPGPYSIIIRVVIVPPPTPTDPNPTFTIPVGSDDVIVHHIFIPGQPGQTLSYTATADREWLFVTPPTGALPPQGVTLDVIINPEELPNGTFTATIIVSISGGLSRGLTAHANTTTSIPITVNLVTPVTPVSSKGPTQYSLIVPAVGHLPGIDSAWQSDVRLTNAGFRSTRYRLTFTRAAGTSGGVKQTDVNVDAGATIAFDDIVKSWYGFGSLGDGESGMLEIVPIDDPPNSSLVTVASSRTYNVTSTGTLGQFIPAIPFPSFIGKAATGGLAQILSLQQIAQSAAYRTNVGLVDGSGKGASAVISIFNGAGTKLLDISQTLAAGQQLQLNALLAQNNITLSDGRIEVKVTGGDGKVTAYASVVDGGTGDPLLVSGVPLTQAGATRYVLPGAANLNAGSADWRTDMRIFNYGNISQTATLTLFPIGGATPLTASVFAEAGKILALDNVVKTLFGGDNIGGAVHVTTAQPASFIVSGRTYNQTATGTYGQFIPGVTVEQGIAKGGRTLHILQVEDSVRSRTNIGVLEISGKPATVELQIVLPDSKFTPVIQVPLAANEYRQFNVIRDLALGNVYNARVAVRVIDGDGRVTAYGSLIDEHTNDPAYIPGQ